jgi:hypothetical protein
MTSLGMPICLGCRHFDRTAPGPGFACAAFPAGIPDAIIESRADHRVPFDGDGGIRFDPIDGEAVAYAVDLFDSELEEPYREPDEETVAAEVA